MTLPPLDENAVVDAVCCHLADRQWQIDQRRTTIEPGIDIIASKDGVRLLIEAKGGTSSFPSSRRYGRPFTDTQALDRVAKGIYTCLGLREGAGPNDHVALAVPSDPYFQRYLQPVQRTLKDLDVSILWVGRDREVSG